MANHKLFIILDNNPVKKKRNLRRIRNGLIYFFEALSLYLKAGFSLSYSWPEILLALGSALPKELLQVLALEQKEDSGSEGIKEALVRLQGETLVAPHQMWFAVLSELYDSGASLTRSVEAITSTLRREQERDLDAHCRALPLRVNVILLLFFLPPTFLWIFAPLVIEIITQFK